ncbi:hypothetical protein OUZ56_026839 [Daphnia magna]|uniref:Uncharacterized protein n=1 Tax=Daphnia magna TaxID=35525 RepID=A0ABQ9ZN30_9CRUS|nr:hypothetical protein OUZ56_026839 [Daphnia magna]
MIVRRLIFPRHQLNTVQLLSAPLQCVQINTGKILLILLICTMLALCKQSGNDLSTSFFAVRCINRNDVHFLDVIAHKTLMYYSYLEVISTFKGKLEEGILFIDIKNENFKHQQVIRIQTEQTQQVFRLKGNLPSSNASINIILMLKSTEISLAECNRLCHVKPLAEYHEILSVPQNERLVIILNRKRYIPT